MTRNELLQTPVNELPVSRHLKESLARQDIKTLSEIMQLPMTEMVNLKWFTEEILTELSELFYGTKHL